MRYRLQRHDGTDCSATMVPITVLRMVPIQRYRQRQDLNRLRRHVTIITVPTFSNKSSKNKLVYLIMKWIDQMIKRITNSDSPLNSQFRIKRHNIVCQSSTIDYVNVY